MQPFVRQMVSAVPPAVRAGLFLLLPALVVPAVAQTSYNIKVLSPVSVYAGQTAYFELTPVYVSGTALSTVYLTSIKLNASPVLPLQAICGVVACGVLNGYPTMAAGGWAGVVSVPVPASEPAGSYTVAFTTSANGVVKTTTTTLQVLTPLAAPFSPALTAPPIPNLAKWESTMIQLGHKWCPAAGTSFSFTTESQVWYYDGARTYFQMSDYTGDRSWDACALVIAAAYRDFVIANSGKIPGYRVFTRGLRLAYERTGDTRYRDAVVLLAKNSAWAPAAGSPEDSLIRETAYVVNAWVEAERLGQPRNPNLTRAADYLLGDFNRLFTTQNYQLNQTFFDGLASEALINYYELTHDPRVLPAIKLELDWMWNVGWVSNKLVYNPDPLGPKCASYCQQYYTDLVNMVTPAFGWYWKMTGNPIYQQRGDQFFYHAFDSDISYSAKVFNQNYHWNNYVAWRTSGVAIASTKPVAVFGTGLSSTGSALADGSVDPHYKLVASADSTAPGPNAYVVKSSGWPMGVWTPDQSTGKWIAPATAQSIGNAAGSYTYRTTFDLTGFTVSTVFLTGGIAADDSVVVKLNGVVVATPAASYAYVASFSISSGFVSGLNTLDFVVKNGSTTKNPTGLLVRLSGSGQ